ncbi:MAG: tRNA preQ1(34) S-adenosylmethionine ribosyltransferase-isomerase QueA [Aminivibrio sp.]
MDLFDTENYDYHLPEELIAQNPAEPRDSSRLLVLSRQKGVMEHALFSSLGDYLRQGDLLVLNDTRVIPARLRGKKAPGGGRVELLLIRAMDAKFRRWEAFVRPGRRIPPGTRIALGEGTEVLAGDRLEEGIRVVEFPEGTDVLPLLARIGEMPLPPYITRSSAPPSSYQTVFAQKNGSAAAPTASLHFTVPLLEKLKKERGVETAWLTLHVGPGTFRPVKCPDLREHRMHEEFCVLPEDTRNMILKTRSAGGRIVAAGTTAARTLESFAREDGSLEWGEKSTGLFIYPGYRFKITDGLITNFHLPRSSLLMLTTAFAGFDNVKKAYEEAVAQEYRFFSFGDAMLII